MFRRRQVFVREVVSGPGIPGCVSSNGSQLLSVWIRGTTDLSEERKEMANGHVVAQTMSRGLYFALELERRTSADEGKPAGELRPLGGLVIAHWDFLIGPGPGANMIQGGRPATNVEAGHWNCASVNSETCSH